MTVASWLLDPYSGTTEFIEALFNVISQKYVDPWLIWILYPVIVTFLLPVLLILLLYVSSLFLHLYRLRHHVMGVCHMDRWDGARCILAAFWAAHGKIWHGYEVRGFEKIPVDGPAVLVYYHGAIPIDIYYLQANIILQKKRFVRAIGDRFLALIPGFRLLLDVFGITTGSFTDCVELLNQRHLLAIAPGGVREAYFSNECYQLVWGKRIGFARVAMAAKVPIIPVFTQNCRESFRAVGGGTWSWLRTLYEKTRLPIVPLYGGFPVKMITHVGDPIECDPNITAEELAAKVRVAIEELVQRHQQPIPGSILHALLQRFSWRW